MIERLIKRGISFHFLVVQPLRGKITKKKPENMNQYGLEGSGTWTLVLKYSLSANRKYLWNELFNIEPKCEPVAVLGADVVDGVGLVHKPSLHLE